MGVLFRGGRECRVRAAEDYNGRNGKDVSATASGWHGCPCPGDTSLKITAIRTMIRFVCHYYYY